MQFPNLYPGDPPRGARGRRPCPAIGAGSAHPPTPPGAVPNRIQRETPWPTSASRSCWSPECISGTRRAAGTPRCAVSSTASAGASTSSTCSRRRRCSSRHSSSARRSPTAAGPCCSWAPRSRPATPSRRSRRSAGMPFVNHRWLGGLLTNFQTISLRIKRLHDLERYQTEGQLDAAPDARAHGRPGRPREAPGQPRRRQAHAAPAGRDVRRRPQDRGHRGPGGQAPADPDHRPGRHQLRPGRHRLRDPGQRRRDQVLRDHHAGDRRRRLRGLPDVPGRGGARPQGGRGAGPQGGRGARRPRGGGAPAQGGRGGRRAPGRA